MAKQILPVNYQDDIVSENMNGRRRYNMIQNPDGTVSLVDATEYDLVGTNFGAGQINAITQAVNASADASKVIESLDDIGAVTESGFIAGALPLKELNNNLGGFTPIMDETGKITGYKTKIGGADTVFPFSDKKLTLLGTFVGNQTIDISQYYDGDLTSLTEDNFVVNVTNYTIAITKNSSAADHITEGSTVFSISKSFDSSNNSLSLSGLTGIHTWTASSIWRGRATATLTYELYIV